MSKQAVGKWWIWSWVMMFPAGVLIPSGIVALAAHQGGASDGYGQTMIALIAIGAMFALASLCLQLVAWTGALLNTRQIEDPRWFKALLLGGVIGLATIPVFGIGLLLFGSVLMAYVVAGPDGLRGQSGSVPPPKRTIKRWTDRGFAAVAAGLIAALVVSRLTDFGSVLNGHTLLSLLLICIGVSIAVVGVIAVSAAWWGALFNASRLQDQTWFRRLRASGIIAVATAPLFGLGVVVLSVAMIAYEHAAADSITGQRPDRRERNKLAAGS